MLTLTLSQAQEMQEKVVKANQKAKKAHQRAKLQEEKEKEAERAEKLNAARTHARNLKDKQRLAKKAVFLAQATREETLRQKKERTNPYSAAVSGAQQDLARSTWRAGGSSEDFSPLAGAGASITGTMRPGNTGQASEEVFKGVGSKSVRALVKGKEDLAVMGREEREWLKRETWQKREGALQKTGIQGPVGLGSSRRSLGSGSGVTEGQATSSVMQWV